MKGVLCLLLLTSFAGLAQKPGNSRQPLDLAFFLHQLYDISTLPVYEEGTYSAETSTYDRTGGNNDGFEGTYSYIRRNADSSLVIFDQKGPGVINRIWTPTPTDDTLDFYIDDPLKKTFSIRYLDLFTGKVFPFVAPLCANQLGGYYCYLPIPFSRSCKIVFRGKMTRFHQVGYRLYPPSTAVKSFSVTLDQPEKTALQQVQKTWNRDKRSVKDFYGDNSVSEHQQTITLRPGNSAILFQSVQPGRLAGFELLSSAPLDTIARNIDLKITWDGDPHPAVYCPLADYFGYAFGKASLQGLLAGSDGRLFYSLFPMPYDRSAKIELIYRKTKVLNELSEVKIMGRFYTSTKKRDALREGKFYANWNRENPVTPGKPFTMLQAKGKGHFVGVNLQAQGLNPGITSFFEGDDSTVVDGELRMHGTGSEDFFNGGWYALLDCWDDGMSLPLSGALDYSIPLARTGGYRFFLGDKISFTSSFVHTIEHGPEHNQVPADYTSVSYYYCSGNNAQRELPANHNTDIYVPDTLEIYPQLTLTAMDESLAAEAKWDGTPAKTMYYTVGNETILKMSLQDIPFGEYDVYLDYRTTSGSAQFSLWQRQTQLTEWTDAWSSQPTKIDMRKMARVRLSELNHSLSFRFRTSPQRDKFILCRMVLIRNHYH
ncbi:glycoside hydrolase family 172 protein [Flavihumibacter profundi]|uniref:glycoside hydrolase family 172 protein n=1 Tax=Flavihumibacter profundi TaxID=2716883 RepID=UPI001CC60985|nr:glycoside hydrolase family 172 protein [Flavihumibacter profundi]MBZ5855925.1 DUF2961 domain-containing protein [Flavihumibacter profundi]